MSSDHEEQPAEAELPSATDGSTTKKPKKKRKKNRAKNATSDADGPQPTTSTATTMPPPPVPNALFPSVISKRTGVERIDFGTNDTLTMLQPIPTAVVSEQLDTVLNAVRQLDNTCCHPTGCRTKVTLIYQECTHCQRRFCMRHGLPEVHGCGEAIRQAERAAFLRPVPAKTRQRELDTQKARERLEQKMKDMQLERRAKPAAGGAGGKKK